MKNDKKKEMISKHSYFVVDNTSSYSVIYSDPGLNARVQFVWKDELSLKDEEENEELKDESTIYD